MKIRDSGFNYIITFFFLLMLAGCETSLDFPTHFEPKLSISAQLGPVGWKEEQRVHVYVSQSIYDTSQFYTPENLEVYLKELDPDTTIRLNAESSEAKDYFIFPDGFLKTGRRYSIFASAPGFENIKALTSIPEPSTISDLSIKTISIHTPEQNPFQKNIRYTLQFRINHIPDNRYYHLVFYNEFVGLPNLYLVDPELSDNQPFIHHYAYGVLIDRNNLKDNQLLTFNFVDFVIEGYDLRKLYIELRSVSTEYYKYHTSLARQLNSRDDIFKEPVTIYNNIQGGYGNFSGFARSIISSDLPQ